MATIDRMRVVEMRDYTPYPVLDLMDGVTFTHIKGQFQTARPQKTRSVIGTTRRFDGDRVAAERMGNASLTAQWYVASGASQDAAMSNLERMGQVFEDATAQGRLIEVRMAGTTRSVFYEPRGTPDWSLINYDPLQFTANGVLTAQATIPVAPLAYGAPMDINDRFYTDTLANGDWIRDGSQIPLAISGTALAPVGAPGSYRYRRTIGYPYQDVEMRMQFILGATVANGRWGMFLSGNTAGVDTKLGLELDQATGFVQLVSFTAGARNVLQTFARVATAGLLYEMRLIRVGDSIRALCQQMNFTAGHAQESSISDYTLTQYTGNWVLTGAALGFQAGDVGIYGLAVDAAERIKSFVVRPFTYLGVATPEQVVLTGKIPGSAPAAVDLEVTTNDTGAIGQAPVWGLWSWSERPLVCNLCHSGDFEAVSGAGLNSWNRLVLTNYITNSATSLAQVTGTSRFGAAAMTIVTPASTQSGASFAINRRMKANRQYAAWCWVRSAAGTTSVAAKLGGPGASGVSIGTAKNLSTNWQLVSTLYRPTSDQDSMVFAITTQAATATTFNVDGVVVVEVPTVTLNAAIASTTATTLTVYATPPDTPYLRLDGTLAQPFLFLVDSELMRCTAISGTTWTVERGVEGTTAATHVIDSVVVIAPPIQQHLEGKGAEPAYGIIEGENYAADISTVVSGSPTSFTSYVNTAARGQQTAGLVAAGGNTAALYYYVDPNTIAPDDFTLGEVDVEVFARVVAGQAGVTATVLTSVEPTEKIGTGLVLAGRRRFSREYGSISKSIVLASSGNPFRMVKLGTFPMIVDRQNPQRWRLKLLTATSGTTYWLVDYLMLHPVRYRACGPTGKADDGGVTYPNLIPPDVNWGSTNYAMTKIFRADGSALLRNPIPDGGNVYTLPPAFPDHGLGKTIAFPPGNVDMTFKISDTIPDDPTINTAADMSGGSSASWSCSQRAIVWPRYFVGRGGY